MPSPAPAPLLRTRLVAQFDSVLGRMRSDETRLRQVVLNLLSNAAKFTDAGVITLVARRYGNAAGDWVGRSGIEYQYEDFEVQGYECHPHIPGKVSK